MTQLGEERILPKERCIGSVSYLEDKVTFFILVIRGIIALLNRTMILSLFAS